MRISPLSQLLVLGLVVAGLGQAVSGQVKEETPDTGFFDVVEVEVVNIDVWATDREGNPYPGLTREDFIVLRDGRPVEISNFYAVADGRPRSAEDTTVTAIPEGAELEPPVQPMLHPSLQPTVAPEHRLWLIVYVDNYDIDPLERNRVLPDIWQFLGRTLRPDDQAMLVTYDRSLEVRQPFTHDVARIQRGLEDLIDESGHALTRKRFRFDTLQRIDQSSSSGQALGYAKQYAEEQMNGVQYTVDALKRVIDSLGGLPGRKALLHVSSGVPMAAGEEMFHAVAEKFGGSEAYAEIPRHDTSRRFEEISRHANAHRVAFYTIDAGGLKAFEFGAAEYAGFVSPRLRQTLDSVVTENLQAPLRLMALETGGRSILNQNDILPALTEVGQDFRSFYSLGIATNDSATGRYHDIEVKLRDKRGDLNLRYRPGYRSKTTDTRIRESLSSALLYSYQNNPLGVELTWGREVPQKDGSYLLPIRLQIPMEHLVLLPRTPGTHEVSLQLYYGAVEEDAGTSEIDAAPLGLRLADENVAAARKESLVHNHQLRLSPGRKKIGVAVLDRFGRESSVITLFVQVGPEDAADSTTPKP
ncbi:MAG: VWA domain-containing protein, partial [Thermoanaerobaculia bacterium]|nr:VWA domain-containing protein [Thermoanaerobaculia bacterium]